MIKLLEKEGFEIIGKRGSHIMLQHPSLGAEDITTVPLHSEIAKGTLASILKQSNISREEFLQLHRNRKKR